ncbi:MAG: hypothetical protein CR958_00700, partial [Rhodobacterales bacterium]
GPQTGFALPAARLKALSDQVLDMQEQPADADDEPFDLPQITNPTEVASAVRGVEEFFVRLQSFSECRGVFVTEALVRFLFEFRRQRLGAATDVF